MCVGYFSHGLFGLYLWDDNMRSKENRVVKAYSTARDDVEDYIRQNIVRETERVIWKKERRKESLAGRRARVVDYTWQILDNKLDVQVQVRTFKKNGPGFLAMDGWHRTYWSIDMFDMVDRC